MSLWDDRLLELAANEGPVTAAMARDSGYFDITKAAISKRLIKLSNHGLMNRLPNGVYTITEEGEQYLAGELDARTLTDASEETTEGSTEGTANG